MKKLLQSAEKQNRAVGAFSVGSMEMIIGAVKAAEDMNTPIILQIAEVRLKHSPLHLMAPMMVSAAKNSRVDIAVHLDHGQTIETVQDALNYGFTSVMFDGSHLPFDQNISMTARVAQHAAITGATVEGELGIVGGSEDGSGSHGVRCTNPAEVPEFCTRSGVDAMAVAIGNAHGNYPVSPVLCFDVLSEIHKQTPTPLVLHGGTGITDADFRKAIDLGIRKINIATASFDALARKAGEYLKEEQHPNFFGLSQRMIEGVYENVIRHIKVFNNMD
jgi:ketose-bisphosphate aldolases